MKDIVIYGDEIKIAEGAIVELHCSIGVFYFYKFEKHADRLIIKNVR